MAIKNVKAGSTFLQTGLVKQGGVVIDISAYTITSCVKDSKYQLLTELTCEILPEMGKFTVLATAGQTANWPYDGKPLVWDVKLSVGGVVRYSDTAQINVKRPVTV